MASAAARAAARSTAAASPIRGSQALASVTSRRRRIRTLAPRGAGRRPLDEPVVRVVASAEGPRLACAAPRELPGRGRVVEAGHGDGVLRQRREELALLASHVGARPSDACGVRDPHVREDRHVRLDDARQRGDLAADAHADLEDREAVMGLQTEGDGRDADAVVQVPCGGVARTHRLQERGAELLGGRLSGAAGDREHAGVAATATPRAHVGAGEVAPGDERVVDKDDVRGPRGDGLRCASLLDDDELGPAPDRGLDVVVPVVAFATQRDEGAPARDRAAVARDPARRGPLSAHVRDAAARGRGRGPHGQRGGVRGNGRGHVTRLSRRAGARARTAPRSGRRRGA